MRKSFLVCLMIGCLAASPCLASDPIKIGFAHVFSGSLATFGEVALQGAQLAVNTINEGGGINGRTVLLIKADIGSTPDQGLNAVRTLVNDEKVDVVIGIVFSTIASAVTQEMVRLKTPLIITHAMNNEITGKICNPWVFRMTWTTDQCLRAAALLASQEIKATTWTTVGFDYGFGQETWDLFRQNLTKIKPTKFEPPILVPASTRDWTPTIAALTKSPADGVMVSLWGNSLRDFIKQSNAEGLLKNKKLLCIVGGGVEVLWPLGFLDLPQGIWFGTPYWHEAYEDNPLNSKFVEAYMSLSYSKIPPSYTAYLAYAAVMSYRAAVEKTGVTDKTVIAKTLSGLSIDLPVGSTTFRTEDHQALFDIVFGKSSDEPSKHGKRFRRLNPIKKFPGALVTIPASETGCSMATGR